MIKRLATFFVIALVAVQVYAADCHRTGSVCTDAAASKYISGVWVGVGTVGGCWNWRDTYECVDPNNIDYCAGIAATPGCNKTSEICSSTAWNGTCQLYTATYRCGSSLAPATGVTQLATTYTIIYDAVDASPCASYSSNSSCQLASKVCTDGPSTKNINGLDVYRDCWQWKEDYSCLVSNPVDYCMPLKSAGCTVTSETCTKTAFNGECIEKDFQYRCGDLAPPPPANVTYLNTTYTIVKDQQNTTQCDTYTQNPNCVLASSVCTDGPSTKNINGLDVYKDCWNWSNTYTCANPVLQSNCAELQNNPSCSETSSSCINYMPGGQCALLEHRYKCQTAEGSTTTVTDCGNQMFCINGQCFDTGYPPDGDFANVIANMEIMREATNYKIFQGEANKCHSNVLVNCCKTRGGGEGGRNDQIASQIGASVVRVGAEQVRVWGSRYLFEGLYNTGSEILGEMAFEALGSGALTTVGNVSIFGAEFSVTASEITFVGFDPYSLALAIAVIIIQELMKCESDEIVLQMKRGQGLCHNVGSYCSTKVLGACLEKKQGWCCFPSKLGRIINEQGRAQINKTWGTPKDPECGGFNLAELGQLRFDLMDLSEFINEIVARQTDNSFAVQRIQEKAKSYYAP